MKQQYRILTAAELEKPLPLNAEKRCKRSCPRFVDAWTPTCDRGRIVSKKEAMHHVYGVKIPYPIPPHQTASQTEASKRRTKTKPLSRFVVREAAFQFWVEDSDTGDRFMAMCTRHEDAALIVDALNLHCGVKRDWRAIRRTMESTTYTGQDAHWKLLRGLVEGDGKGRKL